MRRNIDEGARVGSGSTTFEPLEDRRLLSVSPVGAEFTIATDSAPFLAPGTPGVGSYYNGAPSVATNARGDAVVAWAADGADGVDVYARRYAAGGAAVGQTFVVNTSLPGDQALPGVAVADDGSFVLSWASHGAGPTPGVYARRFGGDGHALGDEFLVAANSSDTTVATSPASTRVALAADGQFAVAWEAADVYVRTYAAGGIPQGGAVRVSATTSTSGYANLYGAFVDAGGTYTLVFDNGGGRLSGRRYDAGGAAVTEIVDLRNGDTTYVSAGLAAMDAAGNLVVPWLGPGSIEDIYARRFNPDFTPAGPAFWVSHFGKNPAAAVDAAGNVTIGYTYTTTPANQVQLSTFPAAEGGPGATFLVMGAGARADVAVAVAGDGSVFELSRDADTVGAVHGRWYQSFANPASLGGRVWRDLDADGVQDPGEGGANPPAMTLYNEAGVEITTAAVNYPSGTYTFGEVMPGQAVSVRAAPLTTYFASAPYQGGDPALDSDFDPVTWRSGTVTLGPGESRTGVDLGLIPYAGVSGTVYHDANENGVKDAGEAALAGWTAYADLDGDGQLDAGEPSVLTSTDGKYSIYPLVPGPVTVRLVPQQPWDAAAPKVMTLAPGQGVQALDWANTTTVLEGVPQKSGATVNPSAGLGGGDAQVAFDDQDRAIVAWSSGTNVYFQRYDRTLTPIGAPVLVASGPNARFTRVSATAGGGFLVCWESLPLTSANGTYVRLYDAAGQPLGSAIRVTRLTSLSGSERPAIAVAGLKTGGFVAATQGDDGTMYAERHDAGGAMIGSPVPLGLCNLYDAQPSIAGDANGAFVVSWAQPDAPGGRDRDVYARVFRPDGSAATDAFRVNTSVTSGDQRGPQVAASGVGRFVIGYFNGPGLAVYAQRVDMGGPVGGPINVVVPVNSAKDFGIAMGPAGEFAVVNGGINFADAQYLSPAGAPVALRSILRSSAIPETGPSIAFDSAGNFVVAANERNSSGSGRGVVVQRTVVPPAAVQLAVPASAGPTDLRVRFSSDVVAAPTAGQVSVRELATGRVLDPSEYAWDYDPATRVVRFTLLGVGTTAADGNYRLTVPATAVTDPAGNTLTADFTFDFFVLAGDATRDRVVNFDDLLVLAKNYNKSGATFAQGDFTGDGVVNFDDLLVLAKNYNKTLPATGAAPAPAATIDVQAMAAAMGIAVPMTTSTTKPAPPPAPAKKPPVSPKPAPKPVSKPAVPAPTVAKPPVTSVLRDDDKRKPVFSTTPVAKPAPAKPKAVAKPKAR